MYVNFMYSIPIISNVLQTFNLGCILGYVMSNIKTSGYFLCKFEEEEPKDIIQKYMSAIHLFVWVSHNSAVRRPEF